MSTLLGYRLVLPADDRLPPAIRKLVALADVNALGVVWYEEIERVDIDSTGELYMRRVPTHIPHVEAKGWRRVGEHNTNGDGTQPLVCPSDRTGTLDDPAEPEEPSAAVDEKPMKEGGGPKQPSMGRHLHEGMTSC